MSSADQEAERAQQVIERLLVDPEFRAEFRRDPAGACVAAGLPELAVELGGSGKGMQTLELRESRSSLAGVVMAAAVEGLSVAEAQALVSHRLPGGLGKALRGVKLPRGARALKGTLSPSGVERRVERGLGLRGGSVKGLVGGSGGGSGSSAGGGVPAAGSAGGGVPAAASAGGGAAAAVAGVDPAGTALVGAASEW